MKQSYLKLFNALFFIFFIILFVSNLYAQKEGYTLYWYDEFNGTKLDTTKWKHRGLGARRDGINTKDAVSLDGNGHLLITTTIIDSTQYYVGMIGTGETFNTTYGYFECRAKFGKKIPWDSFWLQCSSSYSKGSPRETGAEVDIFEYYGHKKEPGGYIIEHNIHWADETGNKKSTHAQKAYVNNVDKYVTVAVEWTPDRYSFYVNDVLTYTTKEGISGVDEYIILSEEPRWWKDVLERVGSGTTTRDTFMVDYVKVYKKKKDF